MRPLPTHFDYIIDGSNVLLENKIASKPSVRLFAALLHMLDQNGKTYKVWFDESIHRHLADKGGDTGAFKMLTLALSRDGSPRFEVCPLRALLRLLASVALSFGPAHSSIRNRGTEDGSL